MANRGETFYADRALTTGTTPIAKDFKFTESKSLQFRPEFFNAFNYVQFCSPTLQDGTIGGDSLFGQITPIVHHA